MRVLEKYFTFNHAGQTTFLRLFRLIRLIRLIALTVIGYLLTAVPVHADPLLLETGMLTRSTGLVIVAGLGIEILILRLFIKRPMIEIGAACFLANAVTGFIGFIALLLINIDNIPILPPGPLALAAALIEIPIMLWILAKAPVNRVIPGVLAANAVTLIFALTLIAPSAIDGPEPGATQDLELNRGLASIKEAVLKYNELNGFYPDSLVGGSSESVGSKDPLILSGLISSYPANPYAPFLRSRHFNLKFLLSGLGSPTHEVELDQPNSDWEARWFHTVKADPRFSDRQGKLLCANGLSDSAVPSTLTPTFYHMNGADFIPGCFFYKSYDFDLNGSADDFILGAYGWPDSTGTVPFDIIDGANGELSLCIDSGLCIAGVPDGNPESLIGLYVRGAYGS